MRLREVLCDIRAGFEEARAEAAGEEVRVRLPDVRRHQVRLREDFGAHAALVQQFFQHRPERPTESHRSVFRLGVQRGVALVLDFNSVLCTILIDIL